MDRIYLSKQELCQFQVYVLIHISPAGNKFMKAPLSRGFIKTQKKKWLKVRGPECVFHCIIFLCKMETVYIRLI